MLHDENGIFDANPSWLQLLGYSRLEDIIGKHPAELSAQSAQARRRGLRQSEARLRESEARFSTAFRASPVLITISRLSDARFIEANDALVRWIGLSRDLIVGHHSDELGMWLNSEEREKFLADLQRNGSLREVECQVRSQRGSVHTMLLSADIIEINREAHMLVFGLDNT